VGSVHFQLLATFADGQFPDGGLGRHTELPDRREDIDAAGLPDLVDDIRCGSVANMMICPIARTPSLRDAPEHVD
jgi:hypothetical protein